MSTLAIVEAFADLPDLRRGAGRRHNQALCLALFTLSVSAGCRGFIAISDWLNSYRAELLDLFSPSKNRLPSYSTIRRVLLNLDYKAYSLHIHMTSGSWQLLVKRKKALIFSSVEDEPLGQQVESGSAKHLPFKHLQSIILPFYLSVAHLQGDPSFDRIIVIL